MYKWLIKLIARVFVSNFKSFEGKLFKKKKFMTIHAGREVHKQKYFFLKKEKSIENEKSIKNDNKIFHFPNHVFYSFTSVQNIFQLLHKNVYF